MDWMDNIGQDLPQDDYIETINVDDQESRWLKDRLGKVTGSQLGDLVKKDSKGYKLSESKTAQDMLYKIAWERFLVSESDGMNRLNFSSRPTEHGHDYELEGMLKFQDVTGIAIEPTGYKFITKSDFFGGTPDGFTEDDGLIECKCPWNGGNHLKTLLTGEIYDDKHFYQMQGYMYLTGKNHCWYVTYDPDMPEGLNLSYKKVDRDEEVIKAIENVVQECRKIIEKLIEQAKSKLISNSNGKITIT